MRYIGLVSRPRIITLQKRWEQGPWKIKLYGAKEIDPTVQRHFNVRNPEARFDRGKAAEMIELKIESAEGHTRGLIDQIDTASTEYHGYAFAILRQTSEQESLTLCNWMNDDDLGIRIWNKSEDGQWAESKGFGLTICKWNLGIIQFEQALWHACNECNNRSAYFWEPFYQQEY